VEEYAEGKTVKLSIYVTPEQRAKFKAVCALKEKSMNEVLTETIQEIINEFESARLQKQKGDK
jgi:uncharacterized lipoprotein YajG